MTYKINKTDGSLLTEIIDSAVNTTATDVTLIGKNVIGYGEFINENFVKLLENFSSTSEPNNPITGQLWYDSAEDRMKVYNGTGFKVASGPIVSPTRPATLGQGDFWIDNIENQLYFNDGVDTVLAGPIWKASQGRSGFQIDSVTDTFGNQRTITKLYNNANVLGIFSDYGEFTPSSAIPGFTTIKPGFNTNAGIPNFKFNAVASAAENLVDSSGEIVSFDELLSGSYTFETSNIVTISVGAEPFNALSLNSVYLKSGQSGVLRLSTESSGLDEQFAMEVTPAGTPGAASTTRLYGNVIVDNVSPGQNIYGSSFRLPKFTVAQRDARFYTADNYGELIYNTDTNTVQTYTNSGWVNLN